MHKDCTFTIRCNLKREHAKISILVQNHTCAGNAPVARAQASRMDWLVQKVPTLMTVDASTKSKAIVDAINLHCGHRISAQQA